MFSLLTCSNFPIHEKDTFKWYIMFPALICYVFSFSLLLYKIVRPDNTNGINYWFSTENLYSPIPEPDILSKNYKYNWCAYSQTTLFHIGNNNY